MENAIEKTARQAFDLFAQDWATGNFEPDIAMLVAEMTF